VSVLSPGKKTLKQGPEKEKERKGIEGESECAGGTGGGEILGKEGRGGDDASDDPVANLFLLGYQKKKKLGLFFTSQIVSGEGRLKGKQVGLSEERGRKRREEKKEASTRPQGDL